jgi:tetratricopeptide (TPR) repeat protein
MEAQMQFAMRAFLIRQPGALLPAVIAALLLGTACPALAQDEKAQAAQYAAARQAGDWPQAERLAQQLVDARPQRWEYRHDLARALLNQGKYQESVNAYQAAIPLAEVMSSSQARTDTGVMYTEMGNAYLKLHKNAEAVEAYGKAAPLAANPGVAYFNLCAVFYNMGKSVEAIGACDKAIAADPARADAYFIKGSALFGDGKVGPGGSYTVPAGTVQALEKYLSLAPNGGHAGDVREMLKALK